MRKEPQIMWDEELKMATCLLESNGQVFYGQAVCHPDDQDMCSEKTGIEIAIKRATIDAYCYYRDCLKERLTALNQLYYSINKSKQYNPKAYESRMLRRQICIINSDLTTTKEIIAQLRNELNDYIKAKDVFYNQIRKNRNKESSRNVISDKNN